MIGKLLKFENRSSLRQMAVIWGALLASSVLLSIVIGAENKLNFIPNTLSNAMMTLSSVFYVAVMVATAVFTIVIVVMRFYNGVCGDEGYLTHTLPVTERSIIISKGLSGTLVVTISAIVALLSIWIISIGITGLGYIGEVGKWVVLSNNKAAYVLITIEVVIAIILGIMGSIYRVYASISIGQMANRHRIAWSVVAYIGINMAITTLLVILMMITNIDGVDQMICSFNRYLVDNASEFVYMQVGLGLLLLAEVIQLFVFHVITEIFLTRKLNLL